MFKSALLIVLLVACVNALPAKRQNVYRSPAPRVTLKAGVSIPKRPDGKIIGGSEATQGQFPYQAMLIIDDIYFCGGSLIASDVVMTAGHCATDAQEIVVTMGEVVQSVDTGNEQVRTSSKITPHENYNALLLRNDIALVEVSPAFDLNSNVATISLAPSGPSAGTEVIISGWGKVRDSQLGANDALMYTQLPVADASVCAAVYGSSPDTQICLDTTGPHSSCNGDSGGPMVPLDKSIVYGVTSYGSTEGCTSEIPVAYTRVSSYLDWIATNSGVTA